MVISRETGCLDWHAGLDQGREKEPIGIVAYVWHWNFRNRPKAQGGLYILMITITPRRWGVNSVMQTMASVISAYLVGILGVWQPSDTNSSAVATVTEGLLWGGNVLGFWKGKRMLVGSL